MMMGGSSCCVCWEEVAVGFRIFFFVGDLTSELSVYVGIQDDS